MPSDPIEQFLQDAERAAREGDRDLALELLVLALDTAPADPTVLVRAHTVRSTLASSRNVSARSDFFLDPDEVGVDEPGGSEPSEGDEPADEDDDGADILVDFPELPEVDMPSRTPAGRTPPPGQPRGDEGSGASEEGSGGEEVYGDEADLERMLRDTDPKRRREDQQVHEEASAPDRTEGGGDEGGGGGGRPALALVALWLLIIGLFAGGITMVVNPTLWESVERSALYWVDPLVRAEEAYEDGDYETTLSATGELLAAGDHVDRAHLLRGQVALRKGDTAAARSALGEAVTLSDAWPVLMEASDLLVQAGFAAEAGEGYLRAFENNAPSETWPAVIRGLARSGRLAEARRIRRIYLRSADDSLPAVETWAPDTLTSPDTTAASGTAGDLAGAAGDTLPG